MGGRHERCGSPGTSDGLVSVKRSAFSRKAPCLYGSSRESVIGYSVWCAKSDDQDNGPGLTLYELGPGTSETAIAVSPEAAKVVYRTDHTFGRRESRSPWKHLGVGIEQKFAGPNAEMFNQITT